MTKIVETTDAYINALKKLQTDVLNVLPNFRDNVAAHQFALRWVDNLTNDVALISHLNSYIKDLEKR